MDPLRPLTFDETTLSSAEDVLADCIDAAIEVHRRLGPGLLESAYEDVLVHVLRRRGHHVSVQVHVPLEYDGMRIGTAFRADVVVDGLVLLELKTVADIHKVHVAQLCTYVKLSGRPLGFLLNFDAVPLKHGMKRVCHPEVERMQESARRNRLERMT